MDLHQLAPRVARLAFRDDDAVIASIKVIPGNSSSVYRFEYSVGNHRKAVFVKQANAPGDFRESAERLKRESEITTSVKAGFPETECLGTVSPVGLMDYANAFVTWEVAGISLQEKLNTGLRLRTARSVPELMEYIELAGEWLRRFHGMGLNHAEFDIDRQFAYCTQRLHFLVKRGGMSLEFSESLTSVLAALADAIGRYPAKDVALCHNDFSPHNIIVDGSRLCVLDFSFSAPGLRVFDAACFWHKLEDLKISPLYIDRTVDELQRRFLAACRIDFDLRRPEVKLALVRLVLSKMASLQMCSTLRPALLIQNKRRYSGYLAFLGTLSIP